MKFTNCSHCKMPIPTYMPWCDMCKHPNYAVEPRTVMTDVSNTTSNGTVFISIDEVDDFSVNCDFIEDYDWNQAFFGLTPEEIEAIQGDIVSDHDEQTAKPKYVPETEYKSWDEKLKEELDRGEDTWGRISKRYK